MSEGPERPFKTKTPVDGIMVMMTWHCGICKQNWKSMVDQGMLRRMPSYVKVGGQRVQTRRPDGSMLRAHEDCAKRMLAAMEAAEYRKQRKIIST